MCLCVFVSAAQKESRCTRLNLCEQLTIKLWPLWRTQTATGANCARAQNEMLLSMEPTFKLAITSHSTKFTGNFIFFVPEHSCHCLCNQPLSVTRWTTLPLDYQHFPTFSGDHSHFKGTSSSTNPPRGRKLSLLVRFSAWTMLSSC